MEQYKLKDNIYWVGAIDWSVRNFHGYTTERGATYNAYLIIDEKVALIDTVKSPFAEELLERVSKIIPLEQVDYVISNHVEMDHSGSIPQVMKRCVNASLVTSIPSGLKGLKAHYGDNYPYLGMKGGDTLSLGKRSLSFITTPMLHWPDNMVTYCKEENILFSNDAFGQHYASSHRFDDDTMLPVIMQEAKKYYANILMCYGNQAKKALEMVKDLKLDVIAPSHGVIWKDHITNILDAYENWSKNDPSDGAVVVFDSMWHSTEMIAKTITEAFTQKGIETKLYDLKDNHMSNILPDILTSKFLAVGSPTLNNGMLPTVAGFLCYLKGLSPSNRKAFAFGSYGWGGQSIGQVEEELKLCGFEICMDKIRVPYIPTKEQLHQIFQDVQNII